MRLIDADALMEVIRSKKKFETLSCIEDDVQKGGKDEDEGDNEV